MRFANAGILRRSRLKKEERKPRQNTEDRETNAKRQSEPSLGTKKGESRSFWLFFYFYLIIQVTGELCYERI